MRNWTSPLAKVSLTSNMPGNTQQIHGEHEDCMQYVLEYLRLLHYGAHLTSKISRKVKRFSPEIGACIATAWRKTSQSLGPERIEEILFEALSDKNRLECCRHLYGGLIRDNELFQNLYRAVPENELESFEERLLKSFSREHINPGRYLAVSPRGAVYIVRRGAIRVFQKGAVVATLERGSVFEVCALSDKFVTIHHIHALPVAPTPTSTMAFDMGEGKTSPPFEVSNEVHETEDAGNFEEDSQALSSTLDTFDTEDVCDGPNTEQFQEMLNRMPLVSSAQTSHARLSKGKRRRSLVNGFGLLNRRRSSFDDSARRRFSVQIEKGIQVYPWIAVNISATEDDDWNAPEGSGVELGVLSTDNLRALVADFPNVQRNLEVLSVSVEVQIEKEAEMLRRKQDLLRKRLEIEHKLSRNKELELACRNGDVSMVDETILAGASITDGLDASGATALHIGALFGHADVVRLLLRVGAKRETVDKEGRTALHLCCLVNSWSESVARSLVDLLVHNASSLTCEDQWGNTPLHLASSTGDVVMLSMLMNRVNSLAPASLESLLKAQNRDGFTPLELCDSLESRRVLKPKTHKIADLR